MTDTKWGKGNIYEICSSIVNIINPNGLPPATGLSKVVAFINRQRREIEQLQEDNNRLTILVEDKERTIQILERIINRMNQK